LNHADAKVYLQCFDDATLKALRTNGSTPLPLIQLIADPSWGEDSAVDYNWLRSREGLATIATYADGIGPWIEQLFTAPDGSADDLVANAHAAGLVVHPYTLRADDLGLDAASFNELQRRVFIDAKADGAFSDFSDLTRQFIDHHFNSDSGDSTP
jgi:glycerophosphoryl diester phosphodiesterase